MAATPDVACLSEMGGIMGQNLSLSYGPEPCNQSALRTLPYSPEATAAFAIAITLMMIFTIVGNILVIIAVLTSRSLQGPQNLFLVSLAAADILVATLIIPFSLANELQGYWAFRSLWCEIYLALDVLFCTSSIVHLCAISLDRYLSISQPVSYAARRTPKRIKAAIVVVWLISAVISFPPLLSLDKSEGGVEVCELNSERWYILYSTIGSFFAPCLIMILVYVRIYQIAKQHTRRPPGERRKEGAQGVNVAALDKRPKSSSPSRASPPKSPRVSPPSPYPPRARPETPGNDLQPPEEQPPASSQVPAAVGPPTSPPTFLSLQGDRPPAIPDPQEACKQPHQAAETHTGSLHDDSSSFGSEVEAETRDHGGENGRGQGGPEKMRMTTRGLFQSKKFKGQVQSLAQRYKNTVATPTGTKLASDGLPKPEGTPMSRRKAMVNREKRFTFVLAVVIGVFVVCWFPFFFSYSLVAVCPETCSLPKPLFTFFFWIGYCNSCLNPVIYTIFNKDFRKAFKKILSRNTKGTYF
ncbi:alpha-2B adrenergic receptor [Hypomesus transpacificus]|uniref:alpha-2B adrenergic receptor n=1 Tax=Hypomesus transpacificus TaxID=137520 RepID=UPI001F0717AA|nr:alpha-2B adrenergic receptor [Hypomesus transpacificus]